MPNFVRSSSLRLTRPLFSLPSLPVSMTLPSSAIVPPWIGSRPAIVRSSVDLPEPDGPTMTRTLPLGTSKEMPSNTFVSASA